MHSLFIDKNTFQTVFSLATKQPWLVNKHETLTQLLFEDCINEDQRSLLVDLISRFQHVSNEKYNYYLNELAEEIVTEPGLDDNNTMLVAMAADSSTDSSQYVLYGLKPIMENFGWREHTTVTTFGKVSSNLTKHPDCKNIILIDEFVGSGTTVEGRVKEIAKVLSEKNIDGFTIRVKVLVSTEGGLNRLKEMGIEISAQLKIQKGISDHYPDEIVPLKIELMKNLESILKDTHKGKPLPSLGFGKAESLYCRDGGNVPNNVFPIFWWPIYKDESIRKVLLVRAMGDA